MEKNVWHEYDYKNGKKPDGTHKGLYVIRLKTYGELVPAKWNCNGWFKLLPHSYCDGAYNDFYVTHWMEVEYNENNNV